MAGTRLADLASLVNYTQDGLRVFTKSGVGYFKIEKPVGNVPHDCELSLPPVKYGGVTAVLEPGAALAEDAREIKAAVWDNVKVTVGVEAGRVGKVTEFIPGDGVHPDVYIVKSIPEGKFDARLLDLPTLGW